MNWSQIWETLKPRLKSFAWRLGCYVGVASLAFIAQNLNLFNLPPLVVVIVSQLVSEATKWLNNHTEIFGSKLK